MNICFVCTGNICRSPMAEGILAKLADESGLDIGALSAGIYAWDGNPASSHAINAVKALYDVDLSGHEAKSFSSYLADASDLILCMEGHHAQQARSIAPHAKDKIMTIYEWAYGDAHSGVADPYGGSYAVYKKCAEEIYTLIKTGLDAM